MASVGSLSVDLQLEATNFMTNMKKSQEQANEFAKGVKESFDGLKETFTGLAEVMALDWFKDKINESLEYAENISKLSQETGISTKSLQEWQYAASQSGVSAGDFDQAIKKFTKSLGDAYSGNNEMRKSLRDLGVDTTDPQKAFLELSDGIEHAQDKSAAAAAVLKLMGRSAYDMIPFLSQGAQGILKLSEDADTLGVVLGGDLLENAESAKKKITALEEVVTAEWASVVAQNATAIEGFTSSLIDLVAEVPKAISQLQGLATEFDVMNAKAQLGQWHILDVFKGGEQGAVAKMGVWDYVKDTLNNPKNGALKWGPNGLQLNDYFGYGPTEDQQKAARQVLMKANQDGINGDLGSLDSIRNPSKVHGIPAPTEKKKHEKKGPSEESLTEKYDTAYSSADKAYDSSALALVSDPGQAGKLQDAALDKELDDQITKIKQTTYSTDTKINQERQDSLIALAMETEQNKKTAVDRETAAKIVSEQNALDDQLLSNKTADLQTQLDLATNSIDRKKIQQEIIDAEYAEKDKVLKRNLLLDQMNNADAKTLADDQAKIDGNDANYKNQTASNNKSNAGPLQTMINGIPTTANEINDALQNVAVDGLNKLTDGLQAAVMGTESLGKAFGDMAKSIISDLAKIMIEEEIVKPLANGLMSLFGGGSSVLAAGTGNAFLGIGSYSTDLGSTLDSIGTMTPALATGGSVVGAGTSTSDSILARLSNGEFVVNAAAASKNMALLHAINDNKFADGGLVGGGITGTSLNLGSGVTSIPASALKSVGGTAVKGTGQINVYGVNDPVMIKKICTEVLGQHLNGITQLSVASMIQQQQQPRMR